MNAVDSFSDASAGPGLNATILYYRPAQRAGILQSLVALGMFVNEIDCGAQGSAWPSRKAEADIAIAFVEDTDAHRDVVRLVAQQFSATLAVLPECAMKSPVEGFSCDEAVRESGNTFDHIQECVGRIGQLARSRIQGRRPISESQVSVFGGLHFRASQRWLERGTQVVSLSPTEHGVLRALVSANGHVVPKETLLRELSRSEELASDGYLKTVVLRIRRKVDRLGGDSSLLSSIRGFGYLLKA
ncbi:MAG: helix-turn-helix domain-containing protein [Dehalococcoidia bacterium]